MWLSWSGPQKVLCFIIFLWNGAQVSLRLLTVTHQHVLMTNLSLDGTVSRLLQQYGRFEDSVISVYIKQLLEGLRYIHSRRIIHRDIKGKVAYIKAFKRRQLFSIAP